MQSEFYTKWVNRCRNYEGDYKLAIWNLELRRDEDYTCSLQCALAYLETMSTDYEFHPEQITLRRGGWRDGTVSRQRWYDKDYTYAVADISGTDIEPNTKEGLYVVNYSLDLQKRVYPR